MNGLFVGTWSLHPQQGDTLHYAQAWLDSAQGRPLSLSLPFLPGNMPLTGPAVSAYFDNLLPDSRDIRDRIARRYRTDTTSPFDLLAHIGRDCVGALQIMPPGVEPSDVTKVNATTLTESEVAQYLRASIGHQTATGSDDQANEFRISIAGAQEKTAFLYTEGKWCRPHGATATTHILKLPMGLVGNMKFDLRESIENEWLCSRILAAFGLPVAQCEPLQFEDIKVLAVRRFDRQWSHSADKTPRLVRLPQEDMCQASGLPPTLKYESDGGPGVDRIMSILDGSLQRDRDRRLFFQAQLLFWMLCAPDGHAKNFSLFLRPAGVYELTPLYDVLSAYPLLGEGPGKLSPLRAKMAMAVRSTNAHWRMQEIQRRHWVSIGERHGLTTEDGRSAAVIIDQIIERTPAIIRSVRAELPPEFPEALAESILGGLGAAAERVAG